MVKIQARCHLSGQALEERWLLTVGCIQGRCYLSMRSFRLTIFEAELCLGQAFFQLFTVTGQGYLALPSLVQCCSRYDKYAFTSKARHHFELLSMFYKLSDRASHQVYNNSITSICMTTQIYIHYQPCLYILLVMLYSYAVYVHMIGISICGYYIP